MPSCRIVTSLCIDPKSPPIKSSLAKELLVEAGGFEPPSTPVT